MVKHGFDTVAMSAAEWRALILPQTASPDVVAGYVNGMYANVAAAHEAFPHAILLSYDVNGSRPDAEILDVEPGDATIGQAPAWCRAWRQHKHVLPKPCLYISAGQVNELVATMSAAGIGRSEYLVLSAHYEEVGDRGMHICGPHTCGYGQADGTQWDNHGQHGENTDRLIYSPAFFPLAPQPGAHYERFDNRPRAICAGHSERWIARRYDLYRAMQTRTRHPHRAQLAVLRAACRLLALRLRALRHPNVFWRGWRIRELEARARGEHRS